MSGTNRSTVRGLGAAALLALGGVLVTGCASTGIQAQWTDPQFSNQPLRGAKVLVVCNANETAIQRICAEQVSAQLSISGAVPVIAPASEAPGAGAAPAGDALLATARNLGAKAILQSTIAPDAMIVNPGPTIGIGVGGFGGSGGWSGGGMGGGVGVSMPVGGAGVDTAYGANMVLTDVASGRMMWTSKVTTPASRDVGEQIGKLAKAGVGAAQKSGLL